MAGIKATALFLLGTLTGFGVALFVFVAHLLDPKRPLLYPSSINAFLASIWLVTAGVTGGVAVARRGEGWRLRTVMGAIALLAVLLGVTVEVQRRSREFWRVSVQHRLQATATYAQSWEARLDTRASKGQARDLSKHADWHRRMGSAYSRAAYVPWHPVATVVPCRCQSCATRLESAELP